MHPYGFRSLKECLIGIGIGIILIIVIYLVRH